MSTKLLSLSPVDGATLWSGEATSEPEIDAVIRRSAEVGKDWRRRPVDDRIALVRRYAQYLQDNRSSITTLLSREVGKLDWDAAAEVAAAIAKVELSIDAMDQRRSERQLDVGEVQRRIRFQPLGVTLVLGPFNFPLHLPGGQIIPALLAGNTVVFKPSEQATAVGQWMTEAWHQIGLPDGVLQMITGGVEVAVTAIDSPHVAGVFLTGSRQAGRAIHRQLAGRPGVLLALELGGNNPIVVADGISAATAASIVSFSAFISSGQRCTCARRVVFLASDAATGQLDELVQVTSDLRLGLPGDDPTPHIGPMISESAVKNLNRIYDELLQLGCKPLVPFQVDPRATNLVRPSIVDATEIIDPAKLLRLAELEWFGPLLVVHRAESFDAAVDLAATTPYGLAAALLGGTAEMFEHFVANVGAGVVNWNGPTTGAAGGLPFGGLGDSGNHRPAGFFAIDFCSDPIASLERAEPSSNDPWSIVQ